MKHQQIGFIGGGNMAGSLISGLIAEGYEHEKLWVSDIDQGKLDLLKERFNINTTSDTPALVQEVDILVYAVKPQILRSVVEVVASSLHKNGPLMISIAAGIRIQDFEKWLGKPTAIVRCMPNTPALVQSGATALYASATANEEQRDIAETIMRAVGLTVWVHDESDLDSVTALSGSGPAYFFLLMEAMENVAKDMGLEEQTARLLVQQTAYGAAKLALEATEGPAELRQRVTSPGGTTERALQIFEQEGFRSAVSKAVNAARDRSIELSIKIGDK